MATTTAAKPPADKPGDKPDNKPVLTRDDMSTQRLAVLSAEAEGWRPEIGDEIDGRIIAVKVGRSEIVERLPGRPPTVRVSEYPIVMILRNGSVDGDKAVALHCFHAITQNEVLSARPAFWDRVYVKYIGQRENSKDPNRAPAHVYAMAFPDNVDNANVYDRFTTAPQVVSATE